MNRRLPPNRVTIRCATVADAPAIGACHITCWRQAYRGLVSEEWLAALDDAVRTEMWHQALSESPHPTLVVAEIGERVVGFAAAGTGNDDDPPLRDMELYALYVLESEYGTGVGQRLFDAAVRVRPCSLWVAEGNARAIRFYRRLGFRPDGTRKRIEQWEGLIVIRMLR
jgi:ribosomal protein S18 acetylase RimI-like enzyme